MRKTLTILACVLVSMTTLTENNVSKISEKSSITVREEIINQIEETTEIKEGFLKKSKSEEKHVETENEVEKEENVKYYQSGVASFYGERWNGRKTANGEIFNTSKLTAAHKTLPFGTKLRVTNNNNGKSVVVRINDRGPFIKGRIIDLSKAAFTSIEQVNRGITNVKIEIIG